MTVSSDLVLRALAGPASDPAPDYAAVLAARQPPNKALPTLVSAWEREGRWISPALAYELDLHRRRRVRYDDVHERLSAVAELVPLRGRRLADAYPPGLVRQLNDLDYVAPGEADVWRAGRALVEDGWTVAALTVLLVEGELCPLVRLEREAEDPLLLAPDAVELSALALVGNSWTIPPRRLAEASDLVTPGGDLAMLAAEGVERPFGARDLVDAVVLGERLAPADVETFGRVLDAFELRPEWRVLASRLASVGGLPERLAPTVAATRRRVARERLYPAARRFVRGAAAMWPPQRPVVAYGQHAALRDVANPVAQLARRAVSRVASPARILELGLPLFGFALDANGGGRETAALEPHGHVVVAHTPVGRFVCVPGDVVEESWLDGPAASTDGEAESTAGQS